MDGRIFRLMKSLTVAYPQIMASSGYLQFWHSPHSNYAVTNPRMYQYLPTNVSRQKQVQSRAAGAVYLLMTEKVYWGVLYWWVMCALDEDCIAPKGGQLQCHKKDPQFSTVYAKCHRFDMSALNILASNLYGYNTDAYTDQDQHLVSIARRKTHFYDIQECISPNKNRPV